MIDKEKVIAWLYGLIGSAINAGASAVSVMVISPNEFNFHDGFLNLLKLFGVSAIMGIFLYLKQSPLPSVKSEENKK